MCGCPPCLSPCLLAYVAVRAPVLTAVPSARNHYVPMLPQLPEPSSARACLSDGVPRPSCGCDALRCGRFVTAMAGEIASGTCCIVSLAAFEPPMAPSHGVPCCMKTEASSGFDGSRSSCIGVPAAACCTISQSSAPWLQLPIVQAGGQRATDLS